jgi:exopolysaccharide biosynthesis polyprenyl glycosylphosphotransferase
LFKHISKFKFFLFLSDFFIIYMFSYFVCDFNEKITKALLPLIVAGVYLLIFYIYGLHSFDDYNRARYLIRYIFVFGIASLITTFLCVMIQLQPPRPFPYALGILFPLVYVWHIIFYNSLKNFLQKTQRAIIVSTSGNYEITESLISKKIYLAGVVGDKLNLNGQYLGNIDELEDKCDEHGIELILIDDLHLADKKLFNKILRCKLKGIEVIDLVSFYEKMENKIPVDFINDFYIFYVDLIGFKSKIYFLRLKRVVDVLLSIIGLILSIPIWILVCAGIKISSPGPVLFIQERVGQNGKIFKMIKFRTMHLTSINDPYTRENDKRLFWFGKFIRKFRIDEIPQMINVLKGDMSFIGPRPEIVELSRLYNENIPYYELRHLVKPGITGWAQVNYRYGDSIEDARRKLEYDLFYIKNLSPILDMHILLRTIRVVLFGIGSR